MEIKTKFNSHPTTGSKSITAFFNGRQCTCPYDYALSQMDNHQKAAGYFLKREGLEFTDKNRSFVHGFLFGVKDGGRK